MVLSFIGSYNRNKIKCPALSAKPRPTQKGGKSRSSLKKMWVCHNISNNKIQFREIKSFYTWVYFHIIFFIGSYNRNKIRCPALSAKPRPTKKGGKSRSSLKKMWVCHNTLSMLKPPEGAKLLHHYEHAKSPPTVSFYSIEITKKVFHVYLMRGFQKI